MVAVDSVHLDIDGKQIVATLSARTEHIVEEMGGVDPFALQPALQVGDRDDDGVDRIGRRPVPAGLRGSGRCAHLGCLSNKVSRPYLLWPRTESRCTSAQESAQ